MDRLFITSAVTFSSTDDELMNYQYTTALLSCEESLMNPDSAPNYLKNEQYMKSPLIVYNHCHVKGVLLNAYWMRQDLEVQAAALKADTGLYIRPIALFVLKRQTADSKEVLKKIKQEFIDEGLAEEEIKIKTNTLDEIQGTDLEDEECEVRYIITVSDLKQQWRCPFAYVIASLEERAVVTDFTAMLNIILPMPGEKETTYPGLNTGYIITACTKFEKIIRPLNEHLHDLNLSPEKLIVRNKMVELLKRMSIRDILSKADGEVKGIRFGAAGTFDFK